MMRACLVLIVTSLVLGSCKNHRVGGNDDAVDADASALVLPRRVQDGDPIVTAQFAVDDQSGRPKPYLVLRLDYFPRPEPGRTTLPACFREFPADFALGEARCVDGEGSVPIYAKNVDQDCYTRPQTARASAKEPLLLVGCKKAEAYAYHFDPQIRIDVESR